MYTFKSSIVNEEAILHLISESDIFIFFIDLKSKRYVFTAHKVIMFLSFGAPAAMQGVHASYEAKH